MILLLFYSWQKNCSGLDLLSLQLSRKKWKRQSREERFFALREMSGSVAVDARPSARTEGNNNTSFDVALADAATSPAASQSPQTAGSDATAQTSTGLISPDSLPEISSSSVISSGTTLTIPDGATVIDMGSMTTVNSQSGSTALAQGGSSFEIAQAGPVNPPVAAPTAGSSNSTAATNAILDQIQALMPGSSLVLATKTGAGLPVWLLEKMGIPASWREALPDVPLVAAWIIPATQLVGVYEAINNQDPAKAMEQLGSALTQSTLFIGTSVGEGLGVRGPIAGNSVGQIITIKFNGAAAPTVDLRQGISLTAQGMGPGSPIWAFINSGASGTISSADSSADQLSVGNNAQVGVPLVFGLLARVPGSATAIRALGTTVQTAVIANDIAAPVTAGATLLDDVPGTVFGQLFSNSEGLYIGAATQISRVQLDVPSGEFTVSAPGNTRFGFNLGDTPAAFGNFAADLLPGNSGIEQRLDGLEPTRQTFDEIVDTPTNRVLGTEYANDARLGLYWEDYSKNRDMVSVGWQMITRFGSGSPAERSNISNLYWRPEMEPARIMLNGMFGQGNGMISLPQNMGKDGYFGIDDAGVAFRNLKGSVSPQEYQARLLDTAKQLVAAGWELNFGVPDLAAKIELVKANLSRPATPDPRTNEVSPLYRPGGSLLRAGLDDFGARANVASSGQPLAVPEDLAGNGALANVA
jgi:hypothetical protein